eukprot:m.55148 g.55148  ORF g.55148 m.55148 type:complete len:62 (-) comp6906_c0_seq2:105-290(-)
MLPLCSLFLPSPFELLCSCRSIRDGYLPRRLHRSVEEGILRVLREVIPNLSVASEGARDHW